MPRKYVTGQALRELEASRAGRDPIQPSLDETLARMSEAEIAAALQKRLGLTDPEPPDPDVLQDGTPRSSNPNAGKAGTEPRAASRSDEALAEMSVSQLADYLHDFPQDAERIGRLESQRPESRGGPRKTVSDLVTSTLKSSGG